MQRIGTTLNSLIKIMSGIDMNRLMDDLNEKDKLLLSADSSLNTYKAELKNANDTIDERNKQINNLTTCINDKSHKLNEQQTANNELTRRVDELKRILSQVKAKASAQLSAVKNDLATEKGISSSLASKNENLEAEKQNLKSSKEALETKVAQLDDNAQEYKQVINALNAKLADALRQAAETESNLAQANDTLRHLEEQCDGLKTQLEQLKRQTAEAESVRTATETIADNPGLMMPATAEVPELEDESSAHPFDVSSDLQREVASDTSLCPTQPQKPTPEAVAVEDASEHALCSSPEANTTATVVTADCSEENGEQLPTASTNNVIEENEDEASAGKVSGNANKSVVDEDDFTEEERVFFEDSEYDEDALLEAQKLSIPEVYDVKEKQTINAKDFFSRNENELILWRRTLQEAITLSQPRFICPICRQMVKISGHKLRRGRVCYFTHLRDSDDCPYKTGVPLSKEEIERIKYGRINESERHKRLKSLIYDALTTPRSIENGITNVECEKRILSDLPFMNYRRPDIYAEWNGRKLVFELQLSTTFLSVVVERDLFYRLNNYDIIWIFNFDDNQEYVNLHNLMCKDIYYANKRNVFIFDKEAEAESAARGELVLKCKWLKADGNWSKEKFVTLSELSFDAEYHKPYFFDADEEYLRLNPDVAKARQQMETSREYLLNKLINRQQQQEEGKRRQILAQMTLRERLFAENKTVKLFRVKNRYGYKYENQIVINAKYSSAEEIQENGYAKVGFNRKFGLVRKDGTEVVPVEYKAFNIISAEFGIILATYKRVDLWLHGTRITLCETFDEKKQQISSKEKEGVQTFKIRTEIHPYSTNNSGRWGYRQRYNDTIDERLLLTMQIYGDYANVNADNKFYILTRIGLVGTYPNLVRLDGTDLYIAQDNSSGLYGIIDYTGRVIVEFGYTRLIPTTSKYIMFRKPQGDDGFGIMDYYGVVYCNPIHKRMYFLSQDLFAFSNTEKWGICNALGEKLCEEKFSVLRGYPDGMIKGDPTGFDKGKIKYSDGIVAFLDSGDDLCDLSYNGNIMYTESNNLGQDCISRKSGGRYAIYSTDGERLVDYELLSVEPLSTGEAIVRRLDEKVGIWRDKMTHFFESASNISHLDGAFFTVQDRQSRFALASFSGLLTDFRYYELSIDEDGIIHATRNGVSGILDENGQEVATYTPVEGGYIKDNWGKYNLADSEKKDILPSEYSKIIDIGDGYFRVRQSSYRSYALASFQGLLTGFSYNSVKNIGRGYFAVAKVGRHKWYNVLRWGIIDSSGKSVLSHKYERISKVDADGNVELKYCFKGNKKVLNIKDLKSERNNFEKLTAETEYTAEIVAFMRKWGLIVEIEGSTFIVHRKYLYKPLESFAKKETIVVRYQGLDQDGFPAWSTAMPTTSDDNPQES